MAYLKVSQTYALIKKNLHLWLSRVLAEGNSTAQSPLRVLSGMAMGGSSQCCCTQRWIYGMLRSSVLAYQWVQYGIGQCLFPLWSMGNLVWVRVPLPEWEPHSWDHGF